MFTQVIGAFRSRIPQMCSNRTLVCHLCGHAEEPWGQKHHSVCLWSRRWKLHCSGKVRRGARRRHRWHITHFVTVELFYDMANVSGSRLRSLLYSYYCRVVYYTVTTVELPSSVSGQVFPTAIFFFTSMITWQGLTRMDLSPLCLNAVVLYYSPVLLEAKAFVWV